LPACPAQKFKTSNSEAIIPAQQITMSMRGLLETTAASVRTSSSHAEPFGQSLQVLARGRIPAAQQSTN